MYSIGLAGLNTWGGLWAKSVVPSCSGMIKAEEYGLLGCTGKMEKVWLQIS